MSGRRSGPLSGTHPKEIAVIAVIFGLLPLLPLSRLQFRLLTILVVFVLFTIAMNIIFGHTDQLFLFVGGLGAVGAYTATILGNSVLGVTPWLTLPAGVLFAGLLGATVSYIAAKRHMTVILIAIFTFALQLTIIEVIVGAGSVTGGTAGLSVDDVLIDSQYVFYYLFFILLVGFLILYGYLVNSRFGYATMAIRQDEVAAESLGVDTVRYKVIAGTLGAMMIGLVGAIYGFWSGRITPGTYDFLTIDVLVLIMVTIGGLRTLSGPVIGAIIVLFIEDELGPFFNDVLPTSIRWTLVIFGVLLIVLYLHFRDGIVPTVRELYGESTGGTWESHAVDYEVRSDDRKWGVLAHTAALVGVVIPLGNVIAPWLIWSTKKEDSRFVRDNGRAAVNFQISWTIYMIVAVISIVMLIGVLLVPLLLLGWLGLVLLATVRARKNEVISYPLTIDFLS